MVLAMTVVEATADSSRNFLLEAQLCTVNCVSHVWMAEIADSDKNCAQGVI